MIFELQRTIIDKNAIRSMKVCRTILTFILYLFIIYTTYNAPQYIAKYSHQRLIFVTLQ